ncbi:class A beta-lactamase [Nocardioides zeae]|uniref:Beta-lactamase n=1 Tax=Nocardioides zeae TaxID=1457234 RepID=A0A6P0HK05_9ACTN|nr:class A beta-lactamase [Nocardioides zeae]
MPTRSLLAAAVLGAALVAPAASPSVGAPSVAAPSVAAPSVAVAGVPSERAAAARFAALERQYDARLGVVALEVDTGRVVAHRPDERFAFASTVKALQVGALLRTATEADLDRTVRWTEDDLVTYSPVTEQHVADGLTVRELADAAVRYSDNTAANLLFDELGGPAGLTAELRRIGDTTTTSVREEPDLNTAVPGDVRDTSTPRALARSLASYTLGCVLAPDRRAELVDLLVRNTTGDALVRAGAPDGWTVGDKTGSAAYGTRNDIAVAWPPAGSNRSPVVIAVLTSGDEADDPTHDALVADATRVTFAALGVGRAG